MPSRILRGLASFVLPAALLAAPQAEAAIDWAKVPAKDIAVFYPATVTWERLFTPGRHSGQKKFVDGKNCFSCHGDLDEESLGRELVVAGGYIEPKVIPNKPPFVKVKVRVAHDSDTVYVHLEFNPGDQPNAGMDKEFETKVAMMLDDGSVPDMARAGCWITCHSNAASMTGITENVTKYIADSRVAMDRSGGDEIKPAADIAKMRADGKFIEYWQARLNPGAPAVAVDGTILEKRAENTTHAVSATATQTNGVWAVTFSRKMKAGAPYKDIIPGKVYHVGFSIHAGHTSQRFHYVSFERSLVLDAGKADFVATLRK